MRATSLFSLLCLASSTFGLVISNPTLNPRALVRATRSRPVDPVIAQRQHSPHKAHKRDFCPAGPRPSSGPGSTCSCSFTATCAGNTINVGSDPNNCGKCNNRCDTGESCASGMCTQSAVTVILRIEGKDSTIYEGPITTSGHEVTTVAGGTHMCDGTNGGAYSSPGGTVTSALDDASRCAGFTWDGDYSSRGEDYYITRIGTDVQDEPKSIYWGALINRSYNSDSGCRVQPPAKTEVLWAFDTENRGAYLGLTGPTIVEAGVPTTFYVDVTDGYTGTFEGAGGASVMGQASAPDGTVTLTFANPGLVSIKATRAGATRSNRMDIQVVEQN